MFLKTAVFKLQNKEKLNSSILNSKQKYFMSLDHVAYSGYY